MRWFGDRISSFWDMSVSESVPGRIRWLSIKMKVIRSCSLCLRSEPEAGLEWDFVRALQEKIPVVKNDFIFSAICEELGGIFAICLILVCTMLFSDDRYYCAKDQESVL